MEDHLTLCPVLPVEYKKQIYLDFLTFVTPGTPLGSLKKFNPFGPTVWQAIGNIYMNVLF